MSSALPMRVHILQHVASEGIGTMREWFKQHNAILSTTRVDLDQPLPDTESFDWLIIMGGPMSVYEEDNYPWLIPEKALIRKAIEQDKYVLGICLGGQLIANALGAKVYKNSQPEIGWFPIQKSHHVASWMPEEQTFLCWHNDCFDLPENAISFSTSPATQHQGFCVSKRVWALQFHIEAKEGTCDVFYRVTGSYLPPGNFVQDLTTLATNQHIPASRETVFKLLNLMLEN